ncbi:hypothetical protein NDU88_003211 [Pleurodeles waltl]|uniref:Uncharacterized protein n=1 Tax=Pleurodeles waltl TaxID=8319 RepID=A0AAV7W4Y7_PLEWA|nr:hypothetical protein NDU88_003211 [Pleurodeles waltl]
MPVGAHQSAHPSLPWFSGPFTFAWSLAVGLKCFLSSPSLAAGSLYDHLSLLVPQASISQRPGTCVHSVPQTAPARVSNSVPSGLPTALGVPAPGLFRSYLPVTGTSPTASSGALLPLEWGLVARSSEPQTPASSQALRSQSSAARRRLLLLWILAASDSRGSHWARWGGKGTFLLVAPSVPGAPVRQCSSAREGVLRSGAPDVSSLPRGPESASASSLALIRRPRVSDPDPQGSERTLTALESRLKTRGGQLWWQDLGG